VVQLETLITLHCLPTFTLEQKLELLKVCTTRKSLLDYYKDVASPSYNTFQQVRVNIDAFVRYTNYSHFKVLSYFDENYPLWLKESSYAPILLTYIGSYRPHLQHLTFLTSKINEPVITTQAQRTGYEASLLDFTLVGGFSVHEDQKAYDAALEQNGRCIAFLASGIDYIKSMNVRKVSSFLMRGGVFMSHVHPYGRPTYERYRQRGALLASCSALSLVLCAPQNSQAYYSALTALDEGREVIVHDVGVKHSRGEANRELHNQGARTIQSLADLL
jgi:DNA processing protein